MPGGADSSILLRHLVQQDSSLGMLVGGDCNVGRTGIREGRHQELDGSSAFCGVEGLLRARDDSDELYRRSEA